jgi:2-oxo-4-hydroxy-4-carboxy-5-ureidoimidazoline decarboxylase
MGAAPVAVTDFDALPAEAARALLQPACASDAWLDAVLAGRPYPDLDALLVRSDAAVGALAWPDVEQALAAHPRIGERAGGGDVEAAWSREEQASTATARDDVTLALHRGNVDYEARFGHVFLVCATGRTPEQLLAALHERLDNDAMGEQDVVRRELAAIARLRLARVLR